MTVLANLPISAVESHPLRMLSSFNEAIVAKFMTKIILFLVEVVDKKIAEEEKHIDG